MNDEVKQAQNVVTSENLQEFQLNRMGIKLEEHKEEIKEEAKDEPKEEVKEEIEEEESDGEEKKEKHSLKERFSKLTKQRNEAREEAARIKAEKDAVEAKLKEYETKIAPEPKQDENAKPDPKNFTDAFEYAEKLAQWSAKEAIRNKEKEEKERLDKEKQEKTLETWRSRLEKAKAEIEDYDEVLASTDVTVSDQVRDAILDSEYGPQILYQLASNEELAEKLGKMSVPAALREIGKMEAKLEKPIEKKEEKLKVEVSKAPDPVKPISGGKVETEPVDSKGEVKVDFAQYKALRKAGKLK